MSGLGNLALGSAPLAGGFLLAVATGQLKSPGQLKAPNFRVMVKQDQDILRAIPEEQVSRRAELQHAIDVRIDDLINAIATGRSLREEASGYKGNWRDVVLFLCVALFTFIWWNVPHSRTNWLLTFIVLIVVAAVTGNSGCLGADIEPGAAMMKRARVVFPSLVFTIQMAEPASQISEVTDVLNVKSRRKSKRSAT